MRRAADDQHARAQHAARAAQQHTRAQAYAAPEADGAAGYQGAGPEAGAARTKGRFFPVVASTACWGARLVRSRRQKLLGVNHALCVGVLGRGLVVKTAANACARDERDFGIADRPPFILSANRSLATTTKWAKRADDKNSQEPKEVPPPLGPQFNNAPRGWKRTERC